MELPALPVLGCFQLLSLQIVVKAPIKSAAFALGPRAHDTSCAPSKSESLSPSVLWNTVFKTPWSSRPKALRGLPPNARPPRLGNLMWGSESLLLWENSWNIIIPQFVGHLSGGYGIWLYRECIPCGLALGSSSCLWMWNTFFGRFQSDFTFTHWRRKWQPTPVFLPWESQGQGSLVGCRLWGRTESDTTEAT